eukprot:3085117-Pleurochrysis_carterae.AAC.2
MTVFSLHGNQKLVLTQIRTPTSRINALVLVRGRMQASAASTMTDEEYPGSFVARDPTLLPHDVYSIASEKALSEFCSALNVSC